MNKEGIVKAVKQPSEFNGVLQIGFLMEGVWYNVLGTQEELDVVLQHIKKGNKISFDCGDDRKVSNIVVVEEAKESEGSWADDMTNYEDLLSAAHEKSEKANLNLNMESRPQIDGDGNPLVDFKEKTALYEATLTLTNKDGKVIQRIVDTGDAEGITNDKIKPHFNRMASTRAMARCYRIYTNNAKVSREETSEKGEKPSPHNHKEVKHG